MSIKRENLNISSGEVFKKLAIYVRKAPDKHYGPDHHSVFVTNAENKRTRSTAERWAGKDCELIERDNTPIKNIRLLALDYREQGGRAYKCCDENNHVFDVKEDVILDILKTVGCQPGGILNGEFVWGREHNSSKLISTESATYKQLVSLTELKNKGKISKDQLKKYHVYRTKKGEFILYLGEVYANNFSFGNDYDVKLNSHLINTNNHKSIRTTVDNLNKGALYEENHWSSFSRSPQRTLLPSIPYTDKISRTKMKLFYTFPNKAECLEKDDKDFANSILNRKLKPQLKQDTYYFPYYKKSDVFGFSMKDKLPDFYEEIADCSSFLDDEWAVKRLRQVGRDLYQLYFDFVSNKHNIKTDAFYANMFERVKGESFTYSMLWLTVSFSKEEDDEAKTWREIAKSREIYGQH